LILIYFCSFKPTGKRNSLFNCKLASSKQARKQEQVLIAFLASCCCCCFNCCAANILLFSLFFETRD